MANRKSSVVLYETPTGKVYKMLDAKSGNMYAQEVFDCGGKWNTKEVVDDTIQAIREAIIISNAVMEDFEPAHRHVMLYSSYKLGVESSNQPQPQHDTTQQRNGNSQMKQLLSWKYLVNISAEYPCKG
jgi:hypothetical protein